MKKGEGSFQRTALVLGTICALIFAAAAAKTVKLTREAQGRSGPGSYYDLKVVIPSGKTLPVLEVKKRWYKVTYTGMDVWISENSILAEKTAPSSGLEPVAMGSADIKASPAAISAAIKGFWTRFSLGADRSKLAELPQEGYAVPPSAIDSFESERSGQVGREALYKKYPIDKPYKPGRVPFVKEQSIGYAIASSVAEGKLVPEGQAATYVTCVGSYIASGTERDDIPFRFYILDTPRVNAVSCPGGYIILTRGLLELIHDESELAALLAHEMAHVIAGHGTKAAVDDRIRIKADDAFAELDREVGNDPAEVEELVGITNRAMSIATGPKLDEYEFEADRMALNYLARCGYDLKAQVRLLQGIKAKHEDTIDMFDLNYRNHPDFAKRLALSEKEMKGYRNYTGGTFAEYYRSHMTF